MANVIILCGGFGGVGAAERLPDQEEIEHAMQYITKANLTLTPALNKMWIEPWGRAGNITLYRIHPDMSRGRKAIPPTSSKDM